MEEESVPERVNNPGVHIRREIDSEGLGDGTNTLGYVGASASGDFTFDTGLASRHTYLGDVEETHPRFAFFEGGAVLNLPLFYLEGVVLFPEATLPLRVLQSNFIAAVEKAMSQADVPYTIGIARSYGGVNNWGIPFATVGTTAEIRQYRRLEDGSLNVVARGKQRFRIKRQWIDMEGTPCGEVQIIQEDLPSRTPRDTVGRLAPLRNFAAPPPNTSQSEYLGCRDEDESDAISEESFENAFLLTKRSLHHSDLTSHDGAGKIDVAEDCIGPLHSEGDKRNESGGLEMRKKELTSVTVPGKGVGQKKSSVSRFREVPRTFWPYWVYSMYDSYYLAQKAADKWKQIVGLPSMDGLVWKPDLLSFYIASKIPVSESMRQELLEIDGISYRLRREIELLESFDCVRCKDCKNVIGKRSDMLMMSCEGPLGAYVNPHGCVHEIMTLREANGLFPVGGPVEEYSWFPGQTHLLLIMYGATSQRCRYDSPPLLLHGFPSEANHRLFS
ncbi:uncharacterized protein LOC127812955 isoform X2 [Diospyros lotus]|uniref:uncharacterized protein LOC127812955 isoform X2 n=1 Tax=Diospyros lotus TaxID=55363 RepID=UPI00224E9B09|nr:uncharacterized protein LOC127812955 isoform X2 [Diospyros lotus]